MSMVDSAAVRNDSLNGSTYDNQYPVEFKGNGFEFFKIWIVNVMLTICTVGIYSAWAKVRTKRYFYGNTLIDNSSFEYHADGMQIFKGRVVAIACLIAATLVGYIHPALQIVSYGIIFLLLPWAVRSSLRFNARMSSYRNVRFGFEGTSKRIYTILFLIPLAIIAVAGVIFYGVSLMGESILAAGITTVVALAIYASYPVFHQLLAHYSHNNHRYGAARFAADLKKRSFIWIYVKSVLLAFLVFALLGVLVAGGVYVVSELMGVDFQAIFEGTEEFEEIAESPLFAVIGIAIYAVLIATGAFIAAFLGSRIRNYRFNLTTIGEKVKLNSEFRTGPLFWLNISNFLLLIVTVGVAYPWVKVRHARFYARNTTISSSESLNEFAAAELSNANSLGDELGEAFDLDMDIGI